MPDNLRNIGKADDIRININQDHEVAYWTKTLGVSKEKLQQAINKVGVMVKDIKRYFQDISSSERIKFKSEVFIF